MPQVDLGNDCKIACEIIPPESFWLSKDAEYDWFDRNALLERKESTKANNSNSTNINPILNSNSQRSSVNLKSKAFIIGLPKTQKAAFADSKRRTSCKPTSIRLFPKRSESVGKPIPVSVNEPGSPKVSCMGRVRSKRRRSKPVENYEKQKIGFFSKLLSMFRSNKCKNKNQNSNENVVVEEPVQRRSVSFQVGRFSISSETDGEVPAPGLGGMQRFASGRRSGSWTGEDFNT